MPRKRLTPEEKIAKLQQQIEQANAALSNEKQKIRKKERADDTRRCVISGRYARQHAEANPDSDFAKTLNRLLDEYVTRPSDRELLGLEPRPDIAPKRARKGKLVEEFPEREPA